MNEDTNNKNLIDKKINEEDVSVYAYDKSIVEDFRARFKSDKHKNKVNSVVQIGPLNQMFNILGTLDEDNVIMPFIGLQRLNWQLNLDRQRIPNFHR